MSDIQISRYEITRFVTAYINAKTTFENIDYKSILFSTKYYSEETQMNKTWKIYFLKKQLEFWITQTLFRDCLFSSGVLVWSGKERGDKRTLLCNIWVSEFYTIRFDLTFLLVLGTNKICKMLKQISRLINFLLHRLLQKTMAIQNC